MKLYSVVRLGMRVLLPVVGVGVALAASVCAGPAGCGSLGGQALAPTDTVRASLLWRIVAPTSKPAVLPSAAGRGLAGWQPATVRRVIDGYTYDVLVGGVTAARVRLLNVDAPESGQPFGAQAADSVRAVVQGQLVVVLSVGGDQYGRTLARVRVRRAAFDGRPAVALDSLLVTRGWAWAYAPSGQVVTWAGQQQAAKVALRGLWKCGTSGVVRPGIWRAYNAHEKATAWRGCAW